MDIFKASWKDQYMQLCEKALQSPNGSCIKGLLVSQLKLDVSPLIPQESVTENNEFPKESESESEIQRSCSTCSRRARRRQARRSFDRSTHKVIAHRRNTFARILSEDETDNLYVDLENFNLYESIDDFDENGYLMPKKSTEAVCSNEYTEGGESLSRLSNVCYSVLEDTVEDSLINSHDCNTIKSQAVLNQFENLSLGSDSIIYEKGFQSKATYISDTYETIKTDYYVNNEETCTTPIYMNLPRSASEGSIIASFNDSILFRNPQTHEYSLVNEDHEIYKPLDIQSAEVLVQRTILELSKEYTPLGFDEEENLVANSPLAHDVESIEVQNDYVSEMELCQDSDSRPYEMYSNYVNDDAKISETTESSVDQKIEEGQSCEDVQPIWKSYLYQVQLKAPKPHRVVCTQNIPNRPTFYGKEYHGAIAREAAEHLVKFEGCYLTRESTRQPGTYALTFRFNDAPRNYRLYYDQQEQMHYVGEKRFETIHDLVADGLITLYMEHNAKDYIEQMNINVPQQHGSRKSTQDEEDNQSDETRAHNHQHTMKPLQNTFKASDCEKIHNFKTQTYYGPHWCDYCRNFLWGLKAQGVRCQDCSYDCHKQCSNLIPADCRPDKKLVKRVFGVDLTTLIKAHDLRRPLVVDQCIKEIETRGLSAEGLYRVPGFADDITHLQNAIDKDGVVPDISPNACEDINVVCGLLKLYFRMLPIPVITFDLYDTFVDAVKIEDRIECIKSLVAAIKCLPPAHYETLKYFCRHLQRLTTFKDKNLMSAENLGIVFGPTLMRAPDHMAMEAIGFIQYQKKVIQLLIEEQDVLFEK